MPITNTPHLAQKLVQLGFTRNGNEYRRHGLRTRIEQSWLTFQAKFAGKGKAVGETGQEPGLWKVVRDRIGRPERIFDLPMSATLEQDIWDDETGDPLCPLAEMVAWVVATKSGKLPPGWKCPPREELEDALPDNALTLEIGRFARQGQLICEDNRLSVSFAVHQRVPADLAPQRTACLSQLLADVQNHTRLVRFVETKTTETERAILAMVDLSGAPHFAVPVLLRIAVDALRHVVSQVISEVDLLVDPAVKSTVWEIPSVQEGPAEGSPK